MGRGSRLRTEGSLPGCSVGAAVIIADAARASRAQSIDELLTGVRRHIDGHAQQLTGQMLQRGGFCQPQSRRQRVIHPVRCPVGIGVRVVEGDTGGHEVLRKTPLVARQMGDAAQPQRMVRDEQVHAVLDRIGGDLWGRVHRHERRADVHVRIPEAQSHGVPGFSQVRREPGVEQGYHRGKLHVGPAGLEPTTFPV